MNTVANAWTILLYMFVVMFANIITASTHPLVLLIFIIPWGSWFIGVTFVARDLVQMHYNRMTAYKVIGIALVASAIFSYLHGDTLAIALASTLAFAVSETSDTEVFTRLHLPPHIRVWWSGLVSGLLDSSIFVIVGLSPLGAGFIPWAAVPIAIVSQILVKTLMVSLGFFIVKWLYKCPRCTYFTYGKCFFAHDMAEKTCHNFSLRRF